MRVILDALNTYGLNGLALSLQVLAAALPLLCLFIPKRYGKSAMALMMVWTALLFISRPAFGANAYVNLLRSFMGLVVMYAMMIIYQCMCFGAKQVTPDRFVADFDRVETDGGRSLARKAHILPAPVFAATDQRLLQ